MQNQNKYKSITVDTFDFPLGNLPTDAQHSLLSNSVVESPRTGSFRQTFNLSPREDINVPISLTRNSVFWEKNPRLNQRLSKKNVGKTPCNFSSKSFMFPDANPFSKVSRLNQSVDGVVPGDSKKQKAANIQIQTDSKLDQFPGAVYKNKFDNLRVYNYTAQQKKGPIQTLMRQSFEMDPLDTEFYSVTLPTSLRYSIDAPIEGNSQKDQGQSALSYETKRAAQFNKIQIFSPVNQRRPGKHLKDKEKMKLANEYRFRDYMRDLRVQGKIGFSDMFSESELARGAQPRPESILKSPQSRAGSQSGPQAKSSLSVNQKPKSRQSKLSGESQLKFQEGVTIFKELDNESPLDVSQKQRKSVEFFPRQGQINRIALPITSHHGNLISQSLDFKKNQTLQISNKDKMSPQRHMLFTDSKQIGSNQEFSSACVSGVSFSSPTPAPNQFTPLQQNIRDSMIHANKSSYIEQLDRDSRMNIAFSKLTKEVQAHGIMGDTVTMIEKLKEQQRQRDTFIERQLKQNFDKSNSRLHYENDNTARFPEINMSVDAKTVIRIDPKDSRLCPYNLRYKHVNTVDQFSQMAKKQEQKFATHLTTRTQSKSPSVSSELEAVLQQSEQKGPQSSKKRSSIGPGSRVTSPQSLSSISESQQPSRQSQAKASRATTSSDGWKGYSQASVRFAKIWAARQNPKKPAKTVRQRVDEFEKSLFINQTPQELIQFLDNQIQRRKDKLKVEIVSEACLQKQTFSKHYDIDEFQEQCQRFVEKRLKYRFGDKSKLIYQRLATTSHDCGVQKIANLANYKFNLLKELENEKLEFQRKQKALLEEQERKAENERLRKLEEEKNMREKLKNRKKQLSSERAKEAQRRKIESFKKKTLSFIPQFQQKEETQEDEVEQTEKVILKEDGTPLWVVIDCQHHQSPEELRIQFYNQYKMYIRYLADFEKQYQVHLTKTDIIKRLDEYGFYNMENLSEEEMELFDSKETCIKLLLDPLLHLVKQDLRDFEFAMANPEGLQLPIASTQFDNHDISMYNEHSNQLTLGAQEPKYTITIERRAQEYLDGLRAIFEEGVDQTDFIPPIPQHEDLKVKRYIKVYHDYRIQIICESLHGFTHVSLDSINSEIVQTRVNTFLEKRKAAAKGYLELNFTSFLTEINSWLDRYLEECIINKSEPDEDTRQNDTMTIEDGTASVEHTKSTHSYTANILSEPSTARGTITIPKKKSTAVGQRKSRLPQRDQDMNQNQQIQISIFQNRVQQKKFYDQAKSIHNMVFNTKDEEINLKILKEFEILRAPPTSVCTKVQSNTLVLENESLSNAETQVLKKYLELTSQDPKSQVKILKIKDCKFPDKQLSEIIQGIESQEKITSLHISNNELEKKTMDPLCKILHRSKHLCLQELSLVRVQKISNFTLTAFFKQLCAQSQISKLTFSHTGVLASNLEAFKYFLKFLRSTKLQIPSHQILTHLDLSYLQFSAKQLSKTIRILTGGEYLQFLSLAGNKLIHIENPKGLNFVQRFNEGLLDFLSQNTNNLTHLNLSDMVYLFTKNEPEHMDGISNKLKLPSTVLDKNKVLQILQINRILAQICKSSKSLQVIHLDNNYICLEDKLEIAQKLGCLSYQIDSGQMAQAINQSSLSAQLKETYLKKHEANELKFLKKSTVDHLIGENTEIEDRILGQQILKHINVDQNYKKLDGKPHLLAQEILFNKFTLQRNLMSDKHDLKYSHSHKPFVDMGQSTEKWQLVCEKQQDTILNSKNVIGWQNMCMFCCNLQDVHLYFNYEDDDSVPPEYQQIQDDKVKEMLRKWFLNGITNIKCPVIFGSLTNWKVLEMIPTQLQVLQLLRTKLLTKCERLAKRDEDSLSSKNPKDLISYVDMIFENIDEFKIEQLQKNMTDYIDFLDFDLSQDHFDKMKWANIFSCPSIENCFEKSFFTQLRATAGQHSVIVFDPKSEKFFARNLLIDVRVHNVDIKPAYQEFEQSFNWHNYNLFAATQVLNYSAYNLMILDDLNPDNTPYLNLKMKIPDLLSFVKYYELINDLFIHIAANQKITIMEDFRDSKSRLQHLEELESNPVEDDNQIYPTVQSIDVVNLFGKSSVPDRTVVYNRNEFLQYMLKMSLKKDIKQCFEKTKPDLENETFGFRYFEEFLNNLDPFTQQYINQNMDVLKAIFMTYSTQQNIWNIEKFSENSYKQFGVIDLKTLQMILELYQPKPEKPEDDGKSKKAKNMLNALAQNLQDQVKVNLEKLSLPSTDQQNTARSNASQNASLYKGIVYRNRWNYCLKLRAAVGCNLEYNTQESEITLKGIQQKQEDEIKLILETKSLEEDADGFLKQVVETKNFEQVQVEKKVQKQYKYIRARLMTVDFMEFIKIIIIHSIISRQQNTKEIKLPPPTSRGLWRKIEATLKKTKAFTHTIKMKRRIHTEGVTKMLAEHHCKLEPLSDQQISNIEKYIESPQYRAKLGDHELNPKNLSLPENYTSYKIENIKDKKKRKELILDFKQDDFEVIPDLIERQKFLAQQGSIDIDNPLELILEGTEEQDEDDIGSKVRPTRKDSKYNMPGGQFGSRPGTREMSSSSRGGSRSSQRTKHNMPQRMPQRPPPQKSKFGNLGLQNIMNPNPLQQKFGLKKNVQILEND